VTRYIPIAEQTFARWAVKGQGPKFVKLGRLVAYRVRDVRQWIEAQTRQNTARG
jgi:predicted DNA-binding transcriptional regulator AlpA